MPFKEIRPADYNNNGKIRNRKEFHRNIHGMIEKKYSEFKLRKTIDQMTDLLTMAEVNCGYYVD